MTEFDLGRIIPIDKGEWNDTYSTDAGPGYEKLDKVTSGSGSYLSLVANNTAPLTDRESWFPYVDGASIDALVVALNTEKQNAITAAGAANTQALFAEEKGNLAHTKAGEAEAAKVAANTAAAAASTTAGNANDAATAANSAAGLADSERVNLSNTVDSKLGEVDDKIGEMDNTLSTYEGRMSDAESDIVQLAGEVSQKQSIVVDYTHTGNKEVHIESIDFATGTITATGHGLASNNDMLVTNNQDNTLTFPYVAVPNGLEFGRRYYPVNITTNTFQLSTTNGGSPIVISDKATKDYTKWHLEGYGQVSITNLSLRKFIVEFSGRSNGTSTNTDYFYLYGGKNYGAAGDVWHVDTERQKISFVALGRSILGTMLNGDIWMYNRLEIDATGKRTTVLVNGYRIYSVNDTTRGVARHINGVAVHSSVGDDTITSFTQVSICNGINIKVTKIL